MENRISEQVRKYSYPVLCVLAVVVSLLPVGSNYIMDGGLIQEWIIRVEELAMSPVEGIFDGVNSNLWFIPAALLYKVTGNMVPVYRISMIVLQIGTMCTAQLFFRSIFEKDNSRMTVWLGSLLYMTCPYRISVCYDWADMSGALVWMLLPLYGWALVGMARSGRNYRHICVGAVTLAGIGYADAVHYAIITGVTLILGLVFRYWRWISAGIVSGVLFSPGLLRMVRYLFMGHYPEWNLPVATIMDKGYHIGEFFTIYVWQEGHPGMGAGLLLCMGLLLWLCFMLGRKVTDGLYGGCTVAALVCMLLALNIFPWDVFQRVGGFALRFIGLMETPAIWAGLGYALLMVPAAGAIKQAREEEDRILSIVLPLLTLVVCVAGCVYQCNLLTYQRPPMMLP